jgi:hypothetical protein
LKIALELVDLDEIQVIEDSSATTRIKVIHSDLIKHDHHSFPIYSRRANFDPHPITPHRPAHHFSNFSAYHILKIVALAQIIIIDKRHSSAVAQTRGDLKGYPRIGTSM